MNCKTILRTFYDKIPFGAYGVRLDIDREGGFYLVHDIAEMVKPYNILIFAGKDWHIQNKDISQMIYYMRYSNASRHFILECDAMHVVRSLGRIKNLKHNVVILPKSSGVIYEHRISEACIAYHAEFMQDHYFFCEAINEEDIQELLDIFTRHDISHTKLFITCRDKSRVNKMRKLCKEHKLNLMVDAHSILWGRSY